MASTGRRHFIGVLGAFHGKTIGALSATSKAVFRAPFGGALLPFTHVPVNDVEALTRAFESARFTGNEIAGCIIEPVLGEGGIWVCDDAFLTAARRLCDAHGAALIFDEVQSGMGRTGHMWACQHSGVAPDLMAIGKAFGGGVMPAAAAVGTAKVRPRCTARLDHTRARTRDLAPPRAAPRRCGRATWTTRSCSPPRSAAARWRWRRPSRRCTLWIRRAW